MLTIAEIRAGAAAFANDWATETRENAERQTFWNEWFAIFGINRRARGVVFERNVKKLKGSTGQIDVFWPGKILVEHKSAGEDLEKAMVQAMEYFDGLPEEELPRVIVLTDFARFRVLRLDEPGPKKDVEFPLAELPHEIELFTFLAGYRPRWFEDQDEVNVHAAEMMGRLHDQLAESGYGGHHLRVLLVRLVFLMFADDTGALGETGAFEDFVERKTADDGSDLGARLAQLFEVLDTPIEKRQRALDEPLRLMPYVNGQLFSEQIPMASFSKPMRLGLLLTCRFDWSKISPAVFGSMFQSVMLPDERRQIGAHYTTEANILKLLGPLFLDEYVAELDAITNLADRSQQRARLRAFLAKLRGLRLFDPACGCGNFLVIAYRELRALELQAIRRLLELDPRHREGQQGIDVTLLAQVNVDQFYGIEFEEFPARIAEVAIYLMDHLANQRLSEEFGLYFVRFPLTRAAHIHVGNALQIDWSTVISPTDCDFVLGNPPFVAKKRRTTEQAQDMRHVFGDAPGHGELDYVAAWFELASRYIAGTPTRVGFVATNSAVQGEQVPSLWPRLIDRNMVIDFAHRFFKWTSDARGAATVYVVIVGFSEGGQRPIKVIYDYETATSDPHERVVKRINPYLTDGPNVIVKPRSSPLVPSAPPMRFGSMPNDGGHLIVKPDFKPQVNADSIAAKYVRVLLGARQALHGESRWCLWLLDATPADLRNSPVLKARVAATFEHRDKSTRPATNKLADTPSLFGEIRQPAARYLCVPRHGAQQRKYHPMLMADADVIAHDSTLTIEGADDYVFGLLHSAMFMAWLNNVGGRIKGDPRVSAEMVYNTFPWPETPGHGARKRVVDSAAAVRAAREAHAESTLEDLYDRRAMPADLVRAHRSLDAAVDALYGRGLFGEIKRAARLFERYIELSGTLTASKPKRRRTTPTSAPLT